MSPRIQHKSYAVVWTIGALVALIAVVSAIWCGIKRSAVPKTVLVLIPGFNSNSAAFYGVERLTNALAKLGYRPTVVSEPVANHADVIIRVELTPELGRESYSIQPQPPGNIQIQGGDESGVMYGCLELVRRAESDEALLHLRPIRESPAFSIRGVCVGLQKPYILPGRKVYEYPITRELFPWFYDRAMWIEFLDFIAAQRYNALFLWNGHPFASLVRVPGYEYAVEVPEEEFDRNREHYRWLAEECQRRGIWLVQMFYSLLVSEPFAKRHGIDTQLSDLSAQEALDYTRKSITQFLVDFPHVGLLVCLGEALRGTENQKKFLLETIIPGVHDGMKLAGLKEEPPLIVRAHATDPEVVMPAAAAVYSNLYTMAKYNGEALTTWEPRGLWQRRHQLLSRLAKNHIVNVHILANLEPFRYGSQRFIKKCVTAMRDQLWANGLHLYPLAYWNWPYSPDLADPPLKQWERDWMWYVAWGRYAWNPDVPEHVDRDFWVMEYSRRFGSAAAAQLILEALNDAGECAPMLLRRFGITDGNRQTLSLGMTLEQLTDPEKFNPYPELWLSHAPPGERLQEFVERELRGEHHVGETPAQVIASVLHYSSNAWVKIVIAGARVRKGHDEFRRIMNDVRCIREMSRFYAAKVNAAICVLKYRHTGDIKYLDSAAEHLATSLRHFQRLVQYTTNTYQFANSLQTSHRRIPVVGAVDSTPTNYHWSHLLPVYEEEFTEFTNKLAMLKRRGSGGKSQARKPWPQAGFQLLSTNAETYRVEVGARPFMDRSYRIVELAPELNGLTGIRISHDAAKAGRYEPVEFEVQEPVWVLIGYFRENRSIWLQPPNPDFAADLTEKDEVEPVLVKAVRVENCPELDVYVKRYMPGRHQLRVHGPGSFLILGMVPQGVKFERDPEADIRF